MKIGDYLKDRAIAERQTWQYRAIAYTHGNKSQIGAIIVAMLGRNINPPCFHTGGFKITADGRVLGLYKGHAGAQWASEMVYGSVEDLNTAFRGLAAVLALDEAQQESMFSEIRKFIFLDERAKSFLPGVTNEDGSKI